MIQHVYRPADQAHVALRVDVVAEPPQALFHVLNVHVVVEHEYHLRKHRLTESPERMHHLERMSGVALPNGNERDIVEDALDRQVQVRNFRQGKPQQWQEQPLGRLAEPAVLHGRASHDRAGIDGVPPVRDRGDMEHRVHIGQRIVAGMVAEWALHSVLRRIDLSFYDDLRVFRHLQVHGLRLDQVHGLFAEETGEQHLVDSGRKRRGCGIGHRRVAAQHDRDIDLLPLLRADTRVLGSHLVKLPVHRGRTLIENLYPVHPDVSLAGIWVMRKHKRQRDVASTVLRPAVQDRQLVEIHIVAGHDHFLAAAIAPVVARRHLRQHSQLRNQLSRSLNEPALRHLRLQKVGDLARDVVDIHRPERHAHPLARAEHIDRERNLRSLRVFEEERRAAVGHLHHAVGDFGYLKIGVHRRAYSFELSLALQARQEVLEISISHGRCLRGRPAERPLAAQHLVEHAGQTVLIASPVEIRLAGRLLRAHIGGSANHHAGLGERVVSR